MDWWRHYLVRYLLGNIIGSVIVFVYMSNSGVCGNAFALNNLFSSAPTQKLIILAVLGFAYCYIASVPILVLHAARNQLYDVKKYNDQMPPLVHNLPLNMPLWLCLLSLFMGMFLILFYFFCDACFFEGIEYNSWIKVYFETSFSRSMKVFIVIIFIVVAIIVFIISLMLFKYRDNYYKFLVLLAEKRNAYLSDKKQRKGELIDSYRHLREHGNAFFIVLCELFICPVFLICPPQWLLIIAALWITPGAMIWSFATWIECCFAESYQPTDKK